MPAFTDWLQHSTPGWLLLALVGIAILLLMIIKWRVEPFIASLVTGLLTALAAGVPVRTLVGPAQKAAIIGPTVKDAGYPQPEPASVVAVNDGGSWIASRYFGIR